MNTDNKATCKKHALDPLCVRVLNRTGVQDTIRTFERQTADYCSSKFLGATGGDVADVVASDGSIYRVHAFNQSGTFNAGSGGMADIFMIGGGGGTGDAKYHNGGGGAGGAVWAERYHIDGTNFSILIGQGGVGGNAGLSYGSPGQNGGDTVAFNWVAKGGGAGAYYKLGSPATGHALAGGCGGGGGGNAASDAAGASNQPTYAGIHTYGAAGGSSTVNNGMGAGGGGIGGAGGSNTGSGGDGGAGLDFGQYFGTSYGDHGWFGGGGGGCTYSNGATKSGGQGGGGQGTYVQGQNGQDGTGGGGGGGERGGGQLPGSRGGSGMVLIRYSLKKNDCPTISSSIQPIISALQAAASNITSLCGVTKHLLFMIAIFT